MFLNIVENRLIREIKSFSSKRGKKKAKVNIGSKSNEKRVHEKSITDVIQLRQFVFYVMYDWDNFRFTNHTLRSLLTYTRDLLVRSSSSLTR